MGARAYLDLEEGGERQVAMTEWDLISESATVSRTADEVLALSRRLEKSERPSLARSAYIAGSRLAKLAKDLEEIVDGIREQRIEEARW